jgi:hypothetical protein
VVEIKNGKMVPYPSAEINRYQPGDSPAERLVSVQSVVVDPASKYLWILDTGSIAFGPVAEGGPKLIAVELGTNQIARKIIFPPDVVLICNAGHKVWRSLRIPHPRDRTASSWST